jgi:WD40 repeat protein
MYHKLAIESSPLQAYGALLFSPTRSVIRTLFKDEEPCGIVIKPGMQDQWSNCLLTLEGHSRLVSSVAFSHDSTQLASASDDRTVKVWDARSGECLLTLKSHSHLVNSVAFSHDSTYLASASHDCTVKVWNAHSGECLLTLKVDMILYSISFDPNNKSLRTDTGVINISAVLDSALPSPTTEPQIPQCQGVALGESGKWLTCNSKNVLWLPSEYRPSYSTVLGDVIAIGTGSGSVWIYQVRL